MMAALEDVGHTVRWWRLAADVRAQFDEADFDAVVLDLGLPDGDGLALLRAWRRQSMALPVVIVTARDTLGERIDGLDAGADDFLVKPFANAELIARLRAGHRGEPSGATPRCWWPGACGWMSSAAARVPRRAGQPVADRVRLAARTAAPPRPRAHPPPTGGRRLAESGRSWVSTSRTCAARSVRG